MQATLHRSNTLTTSKQLDIASVLNPLAVDAQRPSRLITKLRQQSDRLSPKIPRSATISASTWIQTRSELT
jgi:hypothetical protein